MRVERTETADGSKWTWTVEVTKADFERADMGPEEKAFFKMASEPDAPMMNLFWALGILARALYLADDPVHSEMAGVTLLDYNPEA